MITFILIALISALIGVAFGYLLRSLITMGKRGSAEVEIKKMLLDSKEEAQKIIDTAEKKATEYTETKTREIKEKEVDLKKADERLIRKEESIEKKQSDLDQEIEQLKNKAQEVRAIRERAEGLVSERKVALEKVAQLTNEEAKKELLAAVEKESEQDVLVRLQKLEISGKEKYDNRAREILVTAIHRIGNAMPTDVLSTTVELPNEEIKGKIIGKEGRNIRAFERITGVDVIVDDTPGTITISSFDPVRRQVARIALENLIMDGRIQPVKIEEMYKKAEGEINRIIKEKGEQAAYDSKVTGLDPRILQVLGRLHFRTSYGQNVLAHSVEAAHLAGMIATEVGANADIARAGALVHDIGKAVDHEVVGTHVEIGRRILQKFNADERIIRAMESHHEEYPYSTPEAYIVQVADAISGGRPGARRDSIEQYIKRLEDLEAIANRYPGVEKTFAIQGGRELRILVRANEVGDLEAHHLAREIATAVENEMKYPGEIRVNVIREVRAIEFAR
ncbi:MAG: ribonuclease Y [Minisyncoccia bacterium]